ncbi:MAG: hypothetical protein BA862_02560 [Desulfobulbaceae bacterium S3730MH12]|nr:MAG: hypothetical protein BA862_02560 [Desulfobulbaceae bacterium S3730MH12]OEU81650.1 MAG: hypothetical protein BA873_04025 [Desulfobulbaceae bacterium C00003063]
MKVFVILIAIFSFTCTIVQAAEGLINKTSSYNVQKTMDRFEKIVKDKDFNVIARVNHTAAAKKSGSTLRPTELLIFGNPKLGTQLMLSNQTIGIDLPLKVLIWEDDKGVVTLSYNDPAWLQKRHGITDRNKAFAKMTGALDKFSDGAIK